MRRLWFHIHVVSHVAESLAFWVNQDWELLFYCFVNDNHVLIGCVFVGQASQGPVRNSFNVAQDLFEAKFVALFDLVPPVKLLPGIG